MDRMKRFKWYLIIFVSLFVTFHLLTYGMMIRPYKDLRYQITFESPKMVINEAKTSYSSGYIKGEITNNTDKIINLKYIKCEFYNERGTYLGTKYEEFRKFNVTETMKVNIEYDYKNVESVRISLTDEIVEREKSELEKTVATWLPLIGIITIIYALP